MDTRPVTTTVSRLLALLLAPLYLLLVSAMFSELTKTPLVVTLPIIICGASTIMVVLAIFAVKAHLHTGPARQFRLSSVFLATIPLAIYLAAVRWVIQSAIDQDPSLRNEAGMLLWLIVSAPAACFITVSTAILIWFTEAIVWVAIALARPFWGRRRGRV